MIITLRESNKKSAKHMPAFSLAIFFPTKADFVQANSNQRCGDSIRQLANCQKKTRV